MKLKWSKYNYIFPYNNGEYILFNTLSNSIIIIDEKVHNNLICKAKNNNVLKNDIDNYLLESKVFVESDEIEIQNFIEERRINRKQNILDLYIYPTLECNFSCPYCYQIDTVKHKMSNESVKLLCEFIKSKTEIIPPLGIGITWIGGEPLLEIDLIINIYTKIIQVLNQTISIDSMLVTNGYFIDRALEKKLFEKVKINVVQITIDGIENQHNKRRSEKNKNSYMKILENIDLLYLMHPEIKVIIRSNLDKSNKDSFIMLYQSLKNRFPSDNISIVPAFVEDHSSSCSLANTILSRKEQGEFFIELFKKHNLIFTDFHPKINAYSCMAMIENSFAIGPDGFVYKCATSVGKKELALFHLSKPEVINSQFYEPFSNECDYLNNKECLACTMFPVCDGGCPMSRLRENKTNLKGDNCLLAKNNLEEFLLAYMIIKENYEDH